MRQKFFNKIFSAGKGLVLISLLLAEFFGFGLAPRALAACNYNITRMDTQSSVLSTGTLNFNATVTRSGTSGECASSIIMVFLAQADYYSYSGDTSTHWTSLELTRREVSFNNTNTASVTGVPYSLSNFDWSKVPDRNNLALFMRVYVPGQAGVKQESSVWPVSITGSQAGGTPSGARTITVGFDRATYNKNDNMNVRITLNDSSNAPLVTIKTYVNNRLVGSFDKTGAELRTTQLQSIQVTEAAGFHNGSNDITVEMIEKSSGLLFAQGASKMQAQGLTDQTPGGTPTTPTGGTPTTPTGGTPTTPPPQGAGSGVDCSGPNPDPKYCLYNPLPSNELITMFMVITRGFLAIIAIVAVLFVIIGGFRMVISQGNEEAYTKAKQTVTWAIIGVIVASLSFSIVSIVQNLLRTNVKTVDIQNKQGN